MTNAHPTALRTESELIFRAALAAVDATRLVARHLTRHGTDVSVESAGGLSMTWRSPTLVVGAGKAAGRMAAACESILSSENVRGEVIVADGCAVALQSIRVTEAGHPLPDARGHDAARRIIELVKNPAASGILCVVSGGASSLLVCPRYPLRLEDKIRTTQLLLACGADITELNAVRKHLSEVKGGGLARLAAGRVVTLIISDVVNDDPSTIGSGPTTPDATTFAQAWGVLERYGLTGQVPAAVAQLLRSGMDGGTAETLKPKSPDAGKCCNVIIGSNRTALEGAAQAARARGWNVRIDVPPLTGDTTQAARRFGSLILSLARQASVGQPLCVLAGGETTVTVEGKGRGGRNQEFALALAREIAATGIVVLSAGTDGVDGPTDAAGAFVDGSTLQRARECGLNVEAALADNDSFGFFAQLGDLFRCGPTGTNVMDIKVALIAPSAPPVCGSG